MLYMYGYKDNSFCVSTGVTITQTKSGPKKSHFVRKQQQQQQKKTATKKLTFSVFSQFNYYKLFVDY